MEGDKDIAPEEKNPTKPAENSDVATKPKEEPAVAEEAPTTSSAEAPGTQTTEPEKEKANPEAKKPDARAMDVEPETEPKEDTTVSAADTAKPSESAAPAPAAEPNADTPAPDDKVEPSGTSEPPEKKAVEDVSVETKPGTDEPNTKPSASEEKKESVAESAKGDKKDTVKTEPVESADSAKPKAEDQMAVEDSQAGAGDKAPLPTSKAVPGEKRAREPDDKSAAKISPAPVAEGASEAPDESKAAPAAMEEEVDDEPLTKKIKLESGMGASGLGGDDVSLGEVKGKGGVVNATILQRTNASDPPGKSMDSRNAAKSGSSDAGLAGSAGPKASKPPGKAAAAGGGGAATAGGGAGPSPLPQGKGDVNVDGGKPSSRNSVDGGSGKKVLSGASALSMLSGAGASAARAQVPLPGNGNARGARGGLKGLDAAAIGLLAEGARAKKSAAAAARQEGQVERLWTQRTAGVTGTATPVYRVTGSAGSFHRLRDAGGRRSGSTEPSAGGPQTRYRNTRTGDSDAPAAVMSYIAGGSMPNLGPYAQRVIEVRIPVSNLTTKTYEIARRQLWGSGIYTEDSDIIAMLLHSGKFPVRNSIPKGIAGVSVFLRVLYGDEHTYPSSLAHGILSRKWPSSCVYAFKILRTATIPTSQAESLVLKPRRGKQILLGKNTPKVLFMGPPERLYAKYSSKFLQKGKQICEEVFCFTPDGDVAIRNVLPCIRDRGISSKDWTVKRFAKEVLYLGTPQGEYELRRENVGKKSVKNDTYQLAKVVDPSFSEIKTEKSKRKLRGTSSSTISTTPRLVPLAEASVKIEKSGLGWEDIEWHPSQITVSGEVTLKLKYLKFRPLYSSA